ncbi:molecular chaperone [Kluyvera cryocrescens]|uniref:fimbrial biogenesis chaperone n=1 Tax=Kluyvera cryocrescens TaxID=580 RepID=UPI001A206005|nr:molecular chaperone [Kluyvera cryocrescens]MEB7715104.1 molecular chaperone [Kluyvera cryocrescens]HAT1571270.1 molecular chaperone [Kluyvera cryocrescens]
MLRKLLCSAIFLSLYLSASVHAGIVIESTRYLYKEGDREISAQIENKDEIPYLIKSWIETPQGTSPTFMATPPLFRLEGKQKNTVRIFSTGNVNAPTDRESTYYFNVMAIPPADDTYTESNTIQLAVRHRMRLIYRPKTLSSLSINGEAQKISWHKNGNKLTINNPTPFFYYFNTVTIGGREIKNEINSIPPLTSKDVTLKTNVTGSSISWKIMNDFGGAGSLYSSSL